MTTAMTITLLHTAEAHRERFDRIRDRVAPDLTLNHVVPLRFWRDSSSGVADLAASSRISRPRGHSSEAWSRIRLCQFLYWESVPFS